MTKYERMMRRSLHWAAEHRRAGDAEGEKFALQRYRTAAKRAGETFEYAFAGHIDIAKGVGVVS